jgi:hypothetical protein
MGACSRVIRYNIDVMNVESLSREELIAVVVQHEHAIAQREQTIA